MTRGSPPKVADYGLGGRLLALQHCWGGGSRLRPPGYGVGISAFRPACGSGEHNPTLPARSSRDGGDASRGGGGYASRNCAPAPATTRSQAPSLTPQRRPARSSRRSSSLVLLDVVFRSAAPHLLRWLASLPGPPRKMTR